MKKGIRIFGKIIFVIVIMFMINRILWYISVDDVSAYTRHTFREMYTQEENIDILFLGSSHCYRSLNPKITDEIFAKNTFNCGSSSQRLDATYAVLKEVAKRNELQTVYIELYYKMLLNKDYQSDAEVTDIYLVSDYMKPSWNRTELLLNASSPECYINSFVPARRNWQRLLNIPYMARLIIQKCSDSYWGEYPMSDFGNYIGKGYVEAYGTYDPSAKALTRENGDSSQVPERLFEADNAKYLNKIIDYCKENNIELIFFTSPLREEDLEAIGNYDFYVTQVNRFLNGRCAYYDFSLCREDKLYLNNDDYKDNDHLNAYGAKKFSVLFAQFFVENLGYEEVFYNSYAEKVIAKK